MVVGVALQDSSATGVNGIPNESASISGGPNVFEPGPAPVFPEIAIEQAGSDISNGATKSFGPVVTGGNSDLIFDILNTAAAELTLTGTPKVAVTGSPDFTITALSSLFDNAAGAGLFTTSEVQALNAGTPLIARDPATGKFKLTMDWKKSTNLSDFLDFPTPPGSAVSINPQGDVELEFPSTDNAAFYRIEME